MKKFLIIMVCLICFLFGACSATVASAEQIHPLKIWKHNTNGSFDTLVVVDDVTGVNYVVVSAQNYSNAITVGITPRYNADGSLFVSK